MSASVPLLEGRREARPSVKSIPRFYKVLRLLCFLMPPVQKLINVETHSFQTTLGRRFQIYYWRRLIPMTLCFGVLAFVATQPYAQLSFSPLDTMRAQEQEGQLNPFFAGLLHSGLLTLAAVMGTFVNGIALYPKSTLGLLLKIWTLLVNIVQHKLHLPFFSSQPIGRKILYALLLGLLFPASVCAAFFAGQIFRNALVKKTTVDAWVTWGMVVCRISVVFNSIVSLLFTYGVNPWTGITELRKKINAMSKQIIDSSEKMSKDHGVENAGEKDRLKKTQAALLGAKNILEWIALLRIWFLYDNWFNVKTDASPNPIVSRAEKISNMIRSILKWVTLLTITFLATSIQWGGVMAYYNNFAAGLLALIAILALYVDTVNKAFNGIFSKKSYKKDWELIFKQVFSFFVGFFSGLPSTTVAAAASDDDSHNLFHGDINKVELFCSYTNAALLNGYFCFGALTTLFWFFHLFKNFFKSHHSFSSDAYDTGHYPEAVHRGFSQFMERVLEIISDFNLDDKTRELVLKIAEEQSPHTLEDALELKRQVVNWRKASAGGEGLVVEGITCLKDYDCPGFPRAVLALGHDRDFHAVYETQSFAFA